MARINLLPWREELRKKKQQDFIVLLMLGIVLTAIGMGGWHFNNESLIDYQNNRNGYLKREIAEVDERIREIDQLEHKKSQLLSRMNVIQELQTSRPLIVHLMDEIVSTLPEGVYLTNVVQKGSNVFFQGKAQSNARVSSYMRNIEHSKWIQNPSLKIIENREKSAVGMSLFELSASQTIPRKEEE